eukprot:CAMPEP_0197702302 /NCGR_PEP_ID=MMETSP1338-20131121/124325_1 /TAXON_ID=43686 ORGANISM="Pelagodinium beii, Strain RCC1491" /NCGR_SAMPLE_ID=MMETSP1338 /ASSEMBLY_ACC=CAM_ASM_000754 /LENGTH=103 /DNA_ID=CAMNT_0043286121 /DNA_START=429 /DNA_END=740 /DNA_ORIENTATION=-
MSVSALAYWAQVFLPEEALGHLVKVEVSSNQCSHCAQVEEAEEPAHLELVEGSAWESHKTPHRLAVPQRNQGTCDRQPCLLTCFFADSQTEPCVAKTAIPLPH